MRSIAKIFSLVLTPVRKLATWYKKRSLITKIVIMVALVIIALILVARSRPSTASLTTAKVTRDTIVDVVSESGNVAATAQFQVFSPANGYLASILIKNGDIVKKDQKLFEVKSTATPDEKASALANYYQAKASLNAANATAFSLRATMYTNWRHYLDLATNGTYQNGDLTPNANNRLAAEFQVAQDNWNAAQANYNNQVTVVQGATAALTNADLALQGTQDRVVTAPLAGTVANLSANLGDRVQTSQTAVALGSTPLPVLYVGDFSKDLIRIPLNEVDVNKVTTGQKATIVFDAMRDKTYNGTVQTIDRIGTNVAGVITYNASISIDNADNYVKPNMTATATIETSKHENVLTVPNSSIKPYKGGKALLVSGPATKSKKKSNFHYLPVIVGLKGISNTEIISGASEGQDVITAGISAAQLSAAALN